MRIDHLGLDVSDYERSKAFYEEALAPLGMTVLMEPAPGICGLGGDYPFFWIGQRDLGPQTGVHVAFTAKDREMVDAFHGAALAAGGSDNGGPARGEGTPPTRAGSPARATTAPSCSTRTATRSRRSATSPDEGGGGRLQGPWAPGAGREPH